MFISFYIFIKYNLNKYNEIANGIKYNNSLTYLGVENAGEINGLPHNHMPIDLNQEYQKLYDTMQCILDDRVTPLEFYIEYPEIVRTRNIRFSIAGKESNIGQNITGTAFEANIFFYFNITVN